MIMVRRMIIFPGGPQSALAKRVVWGEEKSLRINRKEATATFRQDERI